MSLAGVLSTMTEYAKDLENKIILLEDRIRKLEYELNKHKEEAVDYKHDDHC